LVQENRKLFDRLKKQRNEANHQRITFLQSQRATLALLQEKQHELDLVKSRIFQKGLDLDKIKAEMAQRKAWRNELLHALEEQQQQTTFEEDQQSEEAENSQELSSDTDITALNQILSKTIQQNKKLREELRERGLQLEWGLKDFQGEVSISQDNEDEIDDGVTEEVQNEIEQNVLRALDAFRTATWTDGTEYQKKHWLYYEE